MTRAEKQFELLVATIGRLAGSPDEQRAYLKGLGVEGLNDELALEFDAALGPVRSQVDLLGDSPGVVTKMGRLPAVSRP